MTSQTAQPINMSSMPQGPPPTSPFPTDLPPRPNQPINRAPRRNAFSFTVHAFNPVTRPATHAFRRVCIWVILLVRTAISIITVIAYAAFGSIASAVIAGIFGAIGLVFVAWALALISEFTGERRALGMTWRRLHFDVFLGTMFVLHAGLFIATLLSPTLPIGVSSFCWAVGWILIALVSWIATFPDNRPGMQSNV